MTECTLESNLDLKEAIHCKADRICNECDSKLTCLKIRAKLRKGMVMDLRGEWHKASNEELKNYEKLFGKEWVERFLGSKGER